MPTNVETLLAEQSTSALVDYTIEVSRTVRAATAEIDRAKAHFREIASTKAALSGEAMVTIEGVLGAITVVFPGSVAQAKVLGKDKKADLLQLEGQLSPETFNALFRKKSVIEIVDDAEDYLGKLSKLTPAQQALLANYVEVVESTPRVNIAK